MANSRAISISEDVVNTPAEISALFDSIAYGKVNIMPFSFYNTANY